MAVKKISKIKDGKKAIVKKTVKKKPASGKKKQSAISGKKTKKTTEKTVTSKSKAKSKSMISASKKKTVSKKKAVTKKKVVTKKKAVRKKKAAGKKKDLSNVSPDARFTVNLSNQKINRNVAPGVMIEKKKKHNNKKNKDVQEVKAKKISKITSSQKQKIKELLLEKRNLILNEIQRQMGDSISRSSVVRTDPADRASDVYDGDVSYEMAKTGNIELNEIDAALQKLEKNTYGKCESCEELISSSRLKAKPFASYCTQCRQEKERNSMNGKGDSLWGFLDAYADEVEQD